ncbi:hypothetical protein [Brevibacillus sp. SYP-B805]|uniref:hypothetical protein n=1 Tax=Brevibacillus sp. SYP-B805 TaxID=1578199 RepID=UPI0019D0A639|nr:hypothetical protein [Brevibacillus sp. SYP-B805]
MVKMAILMTCIFLILLFLSFLTFSVLTAIRKAEFEETLLSPARTGEEAEQDE